jgi:deazaflavin-dependent oxidoreductase (nitroreductase family)
MALPPWLARFNRRVTNRISGPLADRLPGFGVVIHTGRRSGQTYRTPVNVFRDADDYLVALTYGAEGDWVRNVQAAGGCELLTHGRRVRLTQPRLVTDPTLRWAPLLVRPLLRWVGVTQYLRLSVDRTPDSPA